MLEYFQPCSSKTTKTKTTTTENLLIADRSRKDFKNYKSIKNSTKIFPNRTNYLKNILGNFLFIIIFNNFISILNASNSMEFTKPNVFSIEPHAEPYYVREKDEDIIIPCKISELFRNRSNYELSWAKSVGEYPITVSRNSKRFSNEAGERYDLSENEQSGDYNLRIRSVELALDNGKFYCTVLDSTANRQLFSTPANIIVVVAPGNPQISAQPNEAVRENEFLTMRCASSGGNPAPKFSWIFDNQTKVPENWHHEKNNFSTAISTLQWHVKREENGAFLTCQIWNQAMHEGEFKRIDTNRLNVLYAPRVFVGPSTELFVEEGDDIELNCQADSNPKATRFNWLHPATGRTYPEPQWPLNKVEIRHSGEYRCSAQNSIDSASSRLQLTVLYAPKVKIIDVGSGSLNPAEGDRLILNCEVDARPEPDKVVWLGPNGFIQNGSRLFIDSIKRDHIGNFTCVASNTLTQLYLGTSDGVQSTFSNPIKRSSEASVFVDVKRRPGKALIRATQTVVEVGSKIELSCTVDEPGSPIAKFRWLTPQSSNTKSEEIDNVEGPQFDILIAKLEDNGRYRCIPFNEIGDGEEAVVRILVVQPAKITRPLPASRQFTAGEYDSAIECAADGFPEPHIEWFKDGLIIDEKVGKHWQILNRPPTGGSLRFVNMIEWNDKGNYTCKATSSPINFIDGLRALATQTSSSQIFVIHEPVILNERFPVQALAAANVGTTAQIRCLVSARPEPKFTWTMDGKEIGENSADSRRYIAHNSRLANRLDEFESVLELNNLEESDYGVYSCSARNTIFKNKAGIATVEIELRSKGPPNIPMLAKILNRGVSWIQFGWLGAFDGGEHQTFELEYRIEDPFTGQINENIEPTHYYFNSINATKIVYYNNPMETNEDNSIFSSHKKVDNSVLNPETFLVHNLTLLRPSYGFYFRIRSKNSLGNSPWTEILRAETLDARNVEDSNSEDKVLQRPESMLYLADEERLIIDVPKTLNPIPPATCALIYAANGHIKPPKWRSVGCYDLPHGDEATKKSLAIENIRPMARFKARFCFRHDMSICSLPLEIYEESSSLISSWKMFLLIGIASGALLIFLAISIICCRFRNFSSSAKSGANLKTTNGALVMRQNKWNKNGINLNGDAVIDRLEVRNSLSGLNAKNTIVHGSQADSGVFTMASCQTGNGAGAATTTTTATNNNNNSDGENQAESSNNPGSETSWPNCSAEEQTGYDFNNDPYLQQPHDFNTSLHNTGHGEGGGGGVPYPLASPQNYAYNFYGDYKNTANGKTPTGAIVMASGATVTSNDPLILTTTDSGSENGSFNGVGAGGVGGSGGGGRIMREIIV